MSTPQLWLRVIAVLVAMIGATATTPAAAADYGYDDASLIYDAPVEVGLGRTIERAATVAPAVELGSASNSGTVALSV